MSDVSICNLALSHLGDAARVTAIEPPDGSVQASYCALHYPIARRTLLTTHTWSCNTARMSLADIGSPSGSWQYRYQYPSTALRVAKILPEYTQSHEPSMPFITEVTPAGTRSILTNQDSAHAVYLIDVTDTTTFTPLMINALGRLLASLLAGPILRGKAGADAAVTQYKLYVAELAVAMAADATQHKVDRTDVKPRAIQARQ